MQVIIVADDIEAWASGSWHVIEQDCPELCPNIVSSIGVDKLSVFKDEAITIKNVPIDSIVSTRGVSANIDADSEGVYITVCDIGSVVIDVLSKGFLPTEINAVCK